MNQNHSELSHSHSIRSCTAEETSTILEIINQAAIAYKGAIPDDCWHEPYMRLEHLKADIEAGVSFIGYEADGRLVGVMGVQRVQNVHLIRHAYVLPSCQGMGVGGALLKQLHNSADGAWLIGTWAAATWAIRFYEHNGFALVPQETTEQLLQTYWQVSDRQIETSVVLMSPPLTVLAIEELVSASR